MEKVSLKSVMKEYPGGVVAVRDLDLEVSAGELLVLVGPSGCGKSTTLRMVAGLESITAGDLYIGERRVNDVHPRDRDIAMVFQSYALYPHMTVAENMAFGLRLRSIPKDVIEARVKDAATTLGIEELLERKPKALSGGQRQRVAMGRALVREPSVFLFDEPLSNLDARLRVQMRLEIARLHHSLQATMLYVTHDQVEAMTLADRIAVMNGGLLQQHGTPMELYHRPANRFVAGFIGSPSMNFIDGQLVSAGGKLSFEGGGLRVTLGSGRAPSDAGAGTLSVGLRPHDLCLGGDSPIARGSVEVIEPMGSESFVHVGLGDERLVVRIDGATSARVGDSVDVSLRNEGWHLFDAQGDNVTQYGDEGVEA
jgi:multiple sugar transport system ATP-binding protein